MTDHERTIGRLEAQVDHLRGQVAEMDKKLDTVLALVEQGKGAKWAIGIVAAIVGALSSYVSAVAGLFRPQ